MSIVLPEMEKSFFELKEVKKQFALYVRDYRMAAIPANSRNGGSWLLSPVPTSRPARPVLALKPTSVDSR